MIRQILLGKRHTLHGRDALAGLDSGDAVDEGETHGGSQQELNTRTQAARFHDHTDAYRSASRFDGRENTGEKQKQKDKKTK